MKEMQAPRNHMFTYWKNFEEFDCGRGFLNSPSLGVDVPSMILFTTQLVNRRPIYYIGSLSLHRDILPLSKQNIVRF